MKLPPSYKEMRLDLLDMVQYLRDNLKQTSNKEASKWLFAIYEEGYFQGVRDYAKDDNRARKSKSKVV